MKYKSLFDVWKQSADSYANDILFCDNKMREVITYKQAFRLVCFLAEKFQKLGLKRFDNICLFAVNSPYWLIIEQAVITLGAVCVSKTSELDIKELEYVYKNSDSCGLITDNYDIINYFKKNNSEFADKAKFIIYTGKSNNDTANTPPPKKF